MLARLVLNFVRWWFGLVAFLGGIGAIVAAPVMIARGNYGGIFMLLGGPILVWMGWVVHPWGPQRKMRGRPLLPS